MTKPASDKQKRAAAAKSPAKPTPARGTRYAADRKQALWDAVIGELESGKTLNKALAAVDGSPTSCNFLAWAKESDARLKQYAEARRVGYEKMADQIIDMSDDIRMGTVVTVKPDGSEEVVCSDMVARSRLQVDSRKWLLARCLPKMYGDRTTIATESGDNLVSALEQIAERLPV